MAFLPRTAVGLVGLMIFTGWLVSLMFGIDLSAVFGISDIRQTAQNNIINAGNCLSSGGVNASNNSAQISVCTGTHWYDAIWEVLAILFNILVMIFGFLAGIFLSTAVFFTAMIGLPIEISQIFIALISAGLIFALIKFIIPDA